MKKSALIALSSLGYFPLTAFAAWNGELPPGCNYANFYPEAISYLDDVPSYFANITPDGKYMAYIGLKTGVTKNYLVRFDDPSTKIRVPFKTDPVPSPDTDLGNGFIATPNGGYALFNYDKLVSYEKTGQTVTPDIEPEIYDKKIQATYESIGLLKKDDNSKTYRIAGGSAVFNDFEVTSEGGKDTVKHVGAYNTRACKNIEKSEEFNKLPMISKDGKYLGNYRTALTPNRTQIYRLNDDGTCDLALDLGIPTGKVSFSYDGRHIAFHVDSFSSDYDRHFATNSADIVKNVYVVDVDPGPHGTLVPTAIHRLTNNIRPGTGSYYPTFTRDGKIACIQSDRSPDGSPIYSFHLLDPDSSPSDPLFTQRAPQGACENEEVSAPYFMLGALLAQVCPPLKALQSSEDQALWTLSLDPDECQEMVREDWAKDRSDLLKTSQAARSHEFAETVLDSVSIEQLLAACPEQKATSEKSPVVYGKPTLAKVEDNPMPAEKIFANRCQECHQKGGNQAPIDWDKITPDQASSMLAMVQSDPPIMPYKSQPLGPVQSKIFIKALEAKEKSAPSSNGNP